MHKEEGEGGRATFVYAHSNVTSDCEIAHVLLGFSKEGEELNTVGRTTVASTHFPRGQGFVKLLTTSYNGLVLQKPKNKQKKSLGILQKWLLIFILHLNCCVQHDYIVLFFNEP
jgi:hypothetical protein